MLESLCSSNVEIRQDIKLLLIRPVDPQGRNDSLFEYSVNYLMPTTRVDQIFCVGGPPAVENMRSYIKASHHVVAKGRGLRRKGMMQ